MDWRLFRRWCVERGLLAFPTSTETLARYLMHLADSGRKVSTIRRARISIGVMHSEHGLVRPDIDDQIRTIERGLAQSASVGDRRAPPLVLADLRRMMSALGNTLRDERDRALLLLGFAGAFRSCELVALNTVDITRTGSGLRVVLSNEKDESLGRGALIEIRPSHDTLVCPVLAVERWLERLPCAQGALFRPVYGTRMTGERLAPRAVSRAVQRAAARARLSTEYSSHSLRSGSGSSSRTQRRNAHDVARKPNSSSAAHSFNLLSATGR